MLVSNELTLENQTQYFVNRCSLLTRITNVLLLYCMLKVMKNSFCMLTENENENGYDNISDQY